MSYVCKIGFSVTSVDDDGFETGENFNVEVGDVFEKEDSPFRVVGGPDTVRLNAKDGRWLEITKIRFLHSFAELRRKA